MNCYLDTAFICALYIRDAHSARAAEWMQTRKDPLPIIWLHRVEVENAFRLCEFRKQISAAESAAAIDVFLKDFQAAVWQSATPDLQATISQAIRLSSLHTPRLGVRSLDILHVAAAIVLEATGFLSFDKRQNALANAAGLVTPMA